MVSFVSVLHFLVLFFMQVEYRVKTDGGTNAFVSAQQGGIRLSSDQTALEYQISNNLTPGTTYDIIVKAFNAATGGTGVSSAPVTGTTGMSVNNGSSVTN